MLGHISIYSRHGDLETPRVAPMKAKALIRPQRKSVQRVAIFWWWLYGLIISSLGFRLLKMKQCLSKMHLPNKNKIHMWYFLTHLFSEDGLLSWFFRAWISLSAKTIWAMSEVRNKDIISQFTGYEKSSAQENSTRAEENEVSQWDLWMFIKITISAAEGNGGKNE